MLCRCTGADMLLEDGTGRAVYELQCDVTDPASPRTADPATWPKCVQQQRCTEVPEPDTNATVSPH